MKKVYVSYSVVACFLLAQPVLAQEKPTPTLEPTTVSATLAAGESLPEHKTLTLPESVMPPRADIIFVMDLTGSMWGALNQVKAGAVDMMNKIAAEIPDVRFGVISHMDYPGSYSGCGYSSPYGSSSDVPYQLNQSLTTDKPAVQAAINSLALGSGADGPEDYTRALYEAYADASIGWRDDAKKIVVFWNDNIPHSCGWPDACPSFSTGPDPGRDGVAGTADDLELDTVLNGLADNNVTLITLHSGSYIDAWECYSQKTGGDAFKLNWDGTPPEGTDVPTYVTGLITEEAKHIDSMTIKTCTDGFESWLTSVEPPAYNDLNLDHEMQFDYDINFTVPEGTEPGRYVFSVCANGDGAKYAGQSVIIEVPKPLIEVPVDINPALCPNTVKLTSRGVISVAILGTADFDVADIDPATVSISGVKPIRWSIKDVATPYSPFTGKSDRMDCTTDGPDGYNDLTLDFSTKDLIPVFGNVADRDVVTLKVDGKLYDATAIAGEDVVIVLKVNVLDYAVPVRRTR
ncbi:VWFA domain-containing protein [Candidatus Electronema halotolerans]